MSVLSAHTSVAVANPHDVIEDMCDHFSEDGAFITGQPGARTVTFDFGAASLTAADGKLLVRAEADDLIELYNFRWTMAQHIVELAGTDEFEWSGDARHLTMPPYFRLLTVTSVKSVTPHMKRVTLRGEDLGAFANDEELHVRLYLPRPAPSIAEWPSVGVNGIPKHPSGEHAPHIRRYTIRSVDIDAGTVDIDFVLHHDAGPGSAFAENATAGDVIGMSGPGASSCPVDRDWYLIAGDETALPAIARILEFLPQSAKGVALIEVATHAEEQDLRVSSDITVQWLHRDERNKSGEPTLVDAIKSVSFPEDGSTSFVWFAGEFNSFRQIRSYLRKDKALKKHQHLAVSYWRDGEKGHDTGEVRGEG